MGFRLNSVSLLAGEFKLGSGEVPIDDMAFCDSAEEAGESDVEMLELE